MLTTVPQSAMQKLRMLMLGDLKKYCCEDQVVFWILTVHLVLKTETF